MFGRSPKNETTIYDAPIQKVLEQMQTYDPATDPEWITLQEQLERLTKLQTEKSKSKVDPNTVALIVGNLAVALIIVMYEQKHVLTTKAMGFVRMAK